MVRKISKKGFFILSILLSTILGFFASGGVSRAEKGGNTVDLSSAVFDKPLFSIEKAYGSEGGGDCCGCGCEPGNIAWPPSASGIVIEVIKV